MSSAESPAERFVCKCLSRRAMSIGLFVSFGRKKFRIVCYFSENLFDDDLISMGLSFLPSDWLLPSELAGNLNTTQIDLMLFCPQKINSSFVYTEAF